MPVPTLNNILNKVPKPEYKDIMVLKNQDTKDIISEILKSHKLYSAQACEIAEDFRGRSVRQSALNIHRFLQKYSNYRIEDINNQTSKSIYRYVWGTDKEGFLYGDCKHQSLFATAILKCLYPKLPVYFRFTSYKLLDSEPTHVYSLIYDQYGNPFTIDPLQDFNSEKFYFSKIDKKLPSMLSRLSGIGSVHMIAGTNIALLIPLAIPRAAYLGLVSLNVARIGSRVKEAILKNPR